MTRVDTLVRDVKLKQSELSGRPQEERRQRLRELLRERTRGMTGEQRFELLNVLKFHFPPFGDVPRDKPPRADGLTLDLGAGCVRDERSRRSPAPMLAPIDAELHEVFSGSDGTRTRDLRRDRPVQAQPLQPAAT